MKFRNYLEQRLNGIYAKYAQKRFEHIYLNYLKNNKYFEESVFLIRLTPVQATQYYNKLKTKLHSKTSKHQRIGMVLIIAGWALFHMGSYSYDLWVDAHQPKTELGPNNSLMITPEQVNRVNPGVVMEREFLQNSSAIGIIDFNQDHTVPVFTPYQGRIGKVMVEAGDEVKVGQVLYTVMSPDLAQAASTLLATAGILKMSNETLKRAKDLYDARSISLKEFEQNGSDQQTAQASYQAALKTIGLFGLSEVQIQKILSGRKIDTEMPVLSPVTGRVISRSAAPGLLVQPGNAPAPVTVSNAMNLWMVASVPESNIGKYRVGQSVNVKVQAYPDKVYSGSIVYIGDASDPVTHRIILRANVVDEGHDLRSQMLADFNVVLGESIPSPAIPTKALVRESDGSFSVWVTTPGGTQFTKRTVQVGEIQEDYAQILDGLRVGEVIAQTNALFLSNLFVNLH